MSSLLPVPPRALVVACGSLLWWIGTLPQLYAAGGSVIAWGNNSSGQTNVPPGLNDIIAVAAGSSHSLALREDGTVVAWGNNTYGQTNVPPGASNVIAIAAGFGHSLALKGDGTVVGWGYNGSGQANPPAGLTNVIAIVASESASFALRTDGAVVPWGAQGISALFSPDIVAIAAGASSHVVGLLNDGTLTQPGAFSGPVPANATSVVAIAAVQRRTMVLRTDGSVLSWEPSVSPSSPSNVSNCVGIAAGQAQSAILLDDGQVLLWSYSGLAVPAPHSNICAVAAGSSHFLGIQNDSPCVTVQPYSQTAFIGKPVTLHMRAMGRSPLYHHWYRDGELLPDKTNPSLRFASAETTDSAAYHCVVSNAFGVVTSSVARLDVVPVAGWGNNLNGQAQIFAALSNVVAVSAGQTHSLGLRADGTLIGWGDNSSGKATPPAGLTNVIAVAAGANHSLALRGNGTVIAWGTNNVGQTNVPASATNIIAIAAGTEHCLALRADGTLVAWGDPGATFDPFRSRDVIQIAAAGYQNLVLLRNGTYVTFGRNTVFPLPPAATNLVSVAAGPNYHLVLRADGTVFGQTFSAPNQTPIPSTLSNIVSISAGGYPGSFGLALKSDGTVASWGTPGYWWPAPPAALSNVTALSSVFTHGLAIVADGSPHITVPPVDRITHISGEAAFTAMAVGASDLHYLWLLNGTPILDATNRTLRLPNVQHSQRGIYKVVVSNSLGIATASAILNVVPIVTWGGVRPEVTTIPPDLDDVTAIAAGDNHSLALGRDGVVRGWGINTSGEATPPPELSNVVALAAGEAHSLALKADGTILGWGDNSAGQATAPPFTDFVALDSRNRYSLGLRRNGTVVAWGDGSQGQTNVPAGLSNVTAIAAGHVHAAAVLASGRVVVWGGSQQGQFNVPIDLSEVVMIIGGRFHTASLTARGSVVGWGYGDGRQTAPSQGLGPFKAVAGHRSYTLALTESGRLHVWDGTPSPLPNLQNVVGIAAKNNHLLALLAHGAPVVRPIGGNRTVYTGNPAILGASVVGPPGLTFQWRKEGAAIPGATNATFVLTSATASDSGSYQLFVNHSEGSTLSSEIQLTVSDSPPHIVMQPLDQSSYLGGKVRLQSVVEGSAPLTYQWRCNDTNIARATNFWLDIDPLAKTDAGDYSLAASNFFGAVTTRSVRVSLVDVAAWGAGTEGQLSVPASVTNITRIAAGDTHSLAVRLDGTVVAWGNNNSGQAAVPQHATNIAALAGGQQHTLALQRDGHVLAWGNNTWGQSSVPAGLSNVLAVAAGGHHSFALRNDGTIIAWGNSDFGATNVPDSATNVVAISSGAFHGVALRNDGTVCAWGLESGGRTNVPADLSNVVAIASRDSTTLALKEDGTVVSWGVYRGVPTNLTRVTSIAVGANFAAVAFDDGTLKAWGNTNVPQNLHGVSQVAAGQSHALALKAETPRDFQITPLTAATSFELRVLTERGRVYRLEYKDSLNDPRWIGSPLIAGNGQLQTLTDSSPAAGQRFYRVGRW